MMGLVNTSSVHRIRTTNFLKIQCWNVEFYIQSRIRDSRLSIILVCAPRLVNSSRIEVRTDKFAFIYWWWRTMVMVNYRILYQKHHLCLKSMVTNARRIQHCQLSANKSNSFTKIANWLRPNQFDSSIIWGVTYVSNRSECFSIFICVRRTKNINCY